MNTLTMPITVAPQQITSVQALQEQIEGQVLTPFDAGYDEARQAFNRAVDQHPDLIVIAASAEDVAATVRFAHLVGMPVAVQATGHGLPRKADGALMLVTAQLKELRIEPETRTARIGAGLEWSEVLEAAQQHGLAPLLGSSPNVGVVGYTLGGGMGWLGRKHGLACDSVIAFELVSAAGEQLLATSEVNPDLFWALRGGGGSFGIITAMEIQLYPVEMVYGGNLLYPAAMAREVMQRYREWVRSAPDALTTSIVLMNFPPFPQVPEPLRGKSFVMVRGCYAGPLEEGETLLRFWRDWRAPAMDTFGPMPFSQVADISQDPKHPVPSRTSAAWMRELSDDAIDAIIRNVLPDGAPPVFTMAEVRHVGGAVSRVPDGESAYSHRDVELLFFCLGAAPTPEAYARVGQAAAALRQELQPALTGGVYMNFVSGQEARERTPEGYSAEALRRLRAVKACYDPENLFRYAFDITPAE